MAPSAASYDDADAVIDISIVNTPQQGANVTDITVVIDQDALAERAPNQAAQGAIDVAERSNHAQLRALLNTQRRQLATRKNKIERLEHALKKAKNKFKKKSKKRISMKQELNHLRVARDLHMDAMREAWRERDEEKAKCEEMRRQTKETIDTMMKRNLEVFLEATARHHTHEWVELLQRPLRLHQPPQED